MGRVGADDALGGGIPLLLLVMVGGSLNSQALGMRAVVQCHLVHHRRAACTEARLGLT